MTSWASGIIFRAQRLAQLVVFCERPILDLIRGTWDVHCTFWGTFPLLKVPTFFVVDKEQTPCLLAQKFSSMAAV